MTMLRIVPPYCGCGWHNTIAARAGSPAAGGASSPSSVSPSLVAIAIERTPVTGRSLEDPDRRAHEREHRGFVTPGVVATRGPAVARVELGAQHDRVVRR